MAIARTNKRLNRQQEQILEGLDKQRCRAIGYANQQCSKLLSDNVDFSPTLHKVIGIATIYTEMARWMRAKRKIHTWWLQRMKERWDITQYIPIPGDKEEAVAGRMMTRESLKEVKIRAPELR